MSLLYTIQMMVTEVKSVWGKLAEDPHQPNGQGPGQAASLPNGAPRPGSVSFIATFSIPRPLSLVMLRRSFVLQWQSLASLPATIRRSLFPDLSRSWRSQFISSSSGLMKLLTWMLWPLFPFLPGWNDAMNTRTNTISRHIWSENLFKV